MNNWVTKTAQPQPPSTAFVNSSTIKFDFDVLDIKQNRIPWLRFEILESGAANMVLTDTGHFAREIRVLEKGRGTIWTIYPDAAYWEMCCLYHSVLQSNPYFKDTNMSDRYYESSNVHKASTTRFYRLPLINFPFAGEYLGNLKSVFTMEIECQPIVVSGSGVPSLQGIAIEFDQRVPSAAEEKALQARMNRLTVKPMLQPVVIEETSKTLTASTEATVDLSSFEGWFSHLLFCVRADSYSSTSSADKQFLPLGDGATVDLIDSNGKSIWANGTAIHADRLLGHMYSQHGISELGESRAIYVLPFCDNIREAFQGKSGGSMYFNRSKIRLQIKLGSTGAATVQTITLANAANDGGSYALAVGPDVSDTLAYNANAAAIKAALEALPALKQANYGPATVTASGALTATATITFNKAVSDEFNDEKHQVRVLGNNLNDGGVAEAAATATTTYGVQGWTTGSSYTVTVIGYRMRRWEQLSGKSRTLDVV